MYKWDTFNNSHVLIMDNEQVCLLNKINNHYCVKACLDNTYHEAKLTADTLDEAKAQAQTWYIQRLQKSIELYQACITYREQLIRQLTPTQPTQVDVGVVAQAIVEILKNSDFNDPTDSSGYFVIRTVDDESERCVDVYKSNANGEEKDHYTVYCSYEDESFEYYYTDDLSVEALEKVLRELAK